MKILAVLGALVLTVACGGATHDEIRHMGSRDDVPAERSSDNDPPDVVDEMTEGGEEQFGSIEEPELQPVGEDPSDAEEPEPAPEAPSMNPVVMNEGPESVPVDEPEPDTYKLVIQFNGPPSAETKAGADDHVVFLFSLTAMQEDLEVEMLPMNIGCDGGRLIGFAGTPYFTDIKVRDVETNQIVAGPRDLAPAVDQMEVLSEWFVFGDPFQIPAGTTRYLAITVDTAPFEDVPGEFFGHDCQVTLTSLEGIVSVGSPPEALPNEAMNITTDIIGNSFVVVPNAPPYDEGVTVALSSATPAGLTVPRNSTYVHVLDITFTAGDVAENVSSLHFSRLGDGAGSDFTNLFLFDEQGNRLTLGRTIDPETDEVVFNGLDIPVSANATVVVSLVGTLSNPEALGGQHAFELWDSEDVVLASGGSVDGLFPVRGNTFTVSENEEITVSSCEVFPYVVATQSVSRGVEAAISTLAFTASSGDTEVSSVVLTQSGTISDSDLSDFRVYVGSTLVAATVTAMDGRIRVELESPLVVEDGTSSFLTLRALVGGEVGDTIRTHIEYPVDLVARDPLYQMYSESIISNFDGSSSSTWVEVTVQ